MTYYHAGLADGERNANQEAFIQDTKPIMVATNAFGMGIDKPDVEFIIHYNIPLSMEAYYQENSDDYDTYNYYSTYVVAPADEENGVDEETATEDACKIEHDLSDASFEAIKNYFSKE